MNPSFQRSLEWYMRLEETPEEDLERMGEGLSLSMGVCDASIQDLFLPEPRALNVSEEGALIGTTCRCRHSLVSLLEPKRV